MPGDATKEAPAPMRQERTPLTDHASSESRSFRDRASRDKLMMDFPEALGRQRLTPPPNPE